MASEIRIARRRDRNAPRLEFFAFPGGSFSVNGGNQQGGNIDDARGYPLPSYIGGRDDAFFNDLPGFFRSINYAPQFYHVPHTDDGSA